MKEKNKEIVMVLMIVAAVVGLVGLIVLSFLTDSPKSRKQVQKQEDARMERVSIQSTGNGRATWEEWRDKETGKTVVCYHSHVYGGVSCVALAEGK